MIGRVEVALRDMISENLALIPQRRDEAVDASAMLRAFAHHIDIVIVDGAHVLVDDDRAFDGQAGAPANFGIGANSRRNHEHIAFESRAILEGKTRDTILTEHLGRAFLKMDNDAHLLHARL